MPRPKRSRHRHSLPVVTCPYCNSTDTQVYCSNEKTLPVRYHKCRNGHNFKSVEVRIMGVAIDPVTQQREVHVRVDDRGATPLSRL